jgi:peptidyl-prolyl cis-trans isomerase A (cyclophilin A)
MRAILLTSLTIFCVSAQTPAKAPAKTTPAATTHHKAPMLNPALYKATAPATFKAKFTTTKGIFVVEVHRDWAPIGADRFYNLVKGGYYDGGPFYRVMAGFMAQFGYGPNPAVNKAWEKATLKDDPVTQSNKRGYITFAKTSAPNSRSTHLFINYVDNAFLDGNGFAPFGTVVLGMEVVDSIYKDYGEKMDQNQVREGGIAYVKKGFPNADLILSAELMPAGT